MCLQINITLLSKTDFWGLWVCDSRICLFCSNKFSRMWRTTFEVKEEMSIFLRSMLRRSLASNAPRQFSILSTRSNQNQCFWLTSTPLRGQLCLIDKSLLTNHKNALSSGSYKYSKVLFWLKKDTWGIFSYTIPGVPTSFRQEFSPKSQNSEMVKKTCESLFTF